MYFVFLFVFLHDATKSEKRNQIIEGFTILEVFVFQDCAP